MPTLRIEYVMSPQESTEERGSSSTIIRSTRREEEKGGGDEHHDDEEQQYIMHQQQEQEKYQSLVKISRKRSNSHSSNASHPSSTPDPHRFVLPMQRMKLLSSSAERLSRFKEEILENAEAPAIYNSEENSSTKSIGLNIGGANTVECAVTLVQFAAGQDKAPSSKKYHDRSTGCSKRASVRRARKRQQRKNCEFVIKGEVEFDDKNNIIKVTNDKKCHTIKKGTSSTPSRIVFNQANVICDVCKKWFCAPSSKKHNRNCFILHKELDKRCKNATFTTRAKLLRK